MLEDYQYILADNDDGTFIVRTATKGYYYSYVGNTSTFKDIFTANGDLPLDRVKVYGVYHGI